MELELFSETNADHIRPWFRDSETRRWLGEEQWVKTELDRLKQPLGAEFKGAKVLAQVAFVAYVDAQPVGFVTAEVYDRYTICVGKTRDGEPIISDSEKIMAAGAAYVINPQARGRGYCVEMLQAFMARPELKDVRLFFAGTEPQNRSSRQCLEKAGFQTENSLPDFENMLYYVHRRT